MENSYFDITKDFPSGTTKGASSGIVDNGGRDWHLYTKKNLEGPYHVLKSGQRCDNFNSIDINDHVKSLSKV